ncbi:MAG: sigma-70 family RNA polymerase sigma factor [Acutalibacteraceae bacterium]|nr:sigma-70 family RNA polymerase sigma factor [Acutalibacteraceae bacterium]
MPEQMENYTDNQLVSFIQKGNSDAFVELTARYLSFIRAKAYPFRSSVLEADDLCQEGLLGLFSAARSYNPNKDASFKTYAGICIQNRIVAAYRSCARKKNIPLSQLVSLNDEETPQLSNIQGTNQAASNPETLLIDRENLEMVHQRIRQSLSKLEQQVLFLYLSGQSYSEIAAKLAIPAKSVDNAIQRVRRKLQSCSLNMPR